MIMEETKQILNPRVTSDSQVENLLTTERIKMLGSAHI